MPKKVHANSASYAIEAMKAASTPLPVVPSHIKMRPGDEPFLSAILRARARSEWMEVDLAIAGQLARTQHDIEKQAAILDTEGTVVENARGTQIMNPRVSVLEQLARREMALMRTLRIGGSVLGNRADLDKKRAVQHQAEKALADIEDEDLLA